LAQLREALLDAALHDVFQLDHAEHARRALLQLGHDERRAAAARVLGVIELKDIVKGGIKERFAELRK
ncbi:hypothetical protein, partial [Burkholderia multivorans]|uniref:hypothetical protein n=1 Tax=Burkholderia multivorans TaxID=87883 RepID=UPI0011C21057